MNLNLVSLLSVVVKNAAETTSNQNSKLIRLILRMRTDDVRKEWANQKRRLMDFFLPCLSSKGDPVKNHDQSHVEDLITGIFKC